MNKKILCAMLMGIAALAALAADNTAPAKQPEGLIKALDELYANSDDTSLLSEEVNSDPNSGLPVGRTIVRTFSCPKDSKWLNDAIKAFGADSDCGYQYRFVDKSNPDLCQIEGPNGFKNLHKKGEMTWMLCAKNPVRPTLRDVYALTISADADPVAGTIYQITSPRPDIAQGKTSAQPIEYKAAIEYQNDSTQTSQAHNNMKSRSVRAGRYKEAIESYRVLIADLNEQILDLARMDTEDKTIDKLKKQLESAYEKMQKLIDSYANEVINNH